MQQPIDPTLATQAIARMAAHVGAAVGYQGDTVVGDAHRTAGRLAMDALDELGILYDNAPVSTRWAGMGDRLIFTVTITIGTRVAGFAAVPEYTRKPLVSPRPRTRKED